NAARRPVVAYRAWLRHYGDAVGAQDLCAAITAAIENHLTKDRQVISRRKQTRVAGDTAHAKRRGIVNLTAQPLFTLLAGVGTTVAEIIHLAAPFFRRRNPRFQDLGRLEARIPHAERHENVLSRELIQH